MYTCIQTSRQKIHKKANAMEKPHTKTIIYNTKRHCVKKTFQLNRPQSLLYIWLLYVFDLYSHKFVYIWCYIYYTRTCSVMEDLPELSLIRTVSCALPLCVAFRSGIAAVTSPGFGRSAPGESRSRSASRSHPRARGYRRRSSTSWTRWGGLATHEGNQIIPEMISEANEHMAARCSLNAEDILWSCPWFRFSKNFVVRAPASSLLNVVKLCRERGYCCRLGGGRLYTVDHTWYKSKFRCDRPDPSASAK